MKLIREEIESVEYITESTENGSKKHYIQGTFLVAEQKNKNGRVYPISVLENEVNRYIKDVIKENRAYGELGHPSGPSINLDRVSHLIKELKRDGNVFVGKAIITETPMGNIARGLLESGANLGVSSRGMGSLQETARGMLVKDDFRLATAADIVADPSAPGAFVQGIMEGVEFWFDPVANTWKEEKLDNMVKKMKKMSLREMEENGLNLFENYMSLLLKK